MNTDTWRFFVNQHDGNGEPTIYRAKPVKQPDDSGDTWRWYWDGDGLVAFIEGYRDGVTCVTNGGDTTRAVSAYKMARDYGGGINDPHAEALKRVARRITGNWDADFICVGLDRGSDLYALSYDGDPDGTWAAEIEAVYHGDVWRFEVEEYQPGFGMGGGDWVPADDSEGDLYGERTAEAAWIDNFPLDEFPAELTI